MAIEEIIKDLEGSWSVGPRSVALKLLSKGYRKQPTNDGWTEWHGGECPVDGDAVVEYKLSHSPKYEWHGRASSLDWMIPNNMPGSVTHYRLPRT